LRHVDFAGIKNATKLCFACFFKKTNIMKNILFILVACFAGLNVNAQNTTPLPLTPANQNEWLNYARNMYFAFGTDNCPQQTLLNYLESIDIQNNPLFNAYKSVAALTSAECIDGLFSKLAAWNKAKPVFDSIVAANPNNPEIHFLQLGIAINAPSIANYSSFINPDANILITSIINNPNVFNDKAYTVRVINWIFKHFDTLTAQQQSQLNAIKENLSQ
jgi:hypothetical protein